MKLSAVRCLRPAALSLLLVVGVVSGCGDSPTAPPLNTSSAVRPDDGLPEKDTVAPSLPQNDNPSAATKPANEPPEDQLAEAPSSTDPEPKVEPASEPVQVVWDDLNLNMQPDVVFRPLFLESNPRAQELDGQRIKILGVMHPGAAGIGEVRDFVLLKNLQCKFGAGGQADHLIKVKLNAAATTNFTDQIIAVEGILKINPWEGPDGNTWSVYDLDGLSVTNNTRL